MFCELNEFEVATVSGGEQESGGGYLWPIVRILALVGVCVVGLYLRRLGQLSDRKPAKLEDFHQD